MTSRILPGLVWLFSVCVAPAALFQYSSGTINLAIPDANPVGVTHEMTVGDFPFALDRVDMRLNIAGGYNGDFYVYMNFQSAQSGVDPVIITLLNHVGSPFGAQDHGLNITLSSLADYNIQSYQQHSPGYNESGQLTGTWQPGGGDLSATTFSGGSGHGNGVWTLFLADTVGNTTFNQGQLVSWGIDLYTLEPVPEPTTWALIIFAVLGGIRALTVAPRKRTISGG